MWSRPALHDSGRIRRRTWSRTRMRTTPLLPFGFSPRDSHIRWSVGQSACSTSPADGTLTASPRGSAGESRIPRNRDRPRGACQSTHRHRGRSPTSGAAPSHARARPSPPSVSDRGRGPVRTIASPTSTRANPDGRGPSRTTSRGPPGFAARGPPRARPPRGTPSFRRGKPGSPSRRRNPDRGGGPPRSTPPPRPPDRDGARPRPCCSTPRRAPVAARGLPRSSGSLRNSLSTHGGPRLCRSMPRSTAGRKRAARRASPARADRRSGENAPSRPAPALPVRLRLHVPGTGLAPFPGQLVVRLQGKGLIVRLEGVAEPLELLQGDALPRPGVRVTGLPLDRLLVPEETHLRISALHRQLRELQEDVGVLFLRLDRLDERLEIGRDGWHR